MRRLRLHLHVLLSTSLSRPAEWPVTGHQLSGAAASSRWARKLREEGPGRVQMALNTPLQNVSFHASASKPVTPVNTTRLGDTGGSIQLELQETPRHPQGWVSRTISKVIREVSWIHDRKRHTRAPWSWRFHHPALICILEYRIRKRLSGFWLMLQRLETRLVAATTTTDLMKPEYSSLSSTIKISKHISLTLTIFLVCQVVRCQGDRLFRFHFVTSTFLVNPLQPLEGNSLYLHFFLFFFF